MHRKPSHFIAGVFIATLSFWAAFSCSGGDSNPDSLTEAFLRYNKLEAVKFTISGDAKCETCLDNDIPILGMQIEIVAKEDPVHEIAAKLYDDLGPFEIENISGKQGATLEIKGTLMRQSVSLHGYAEVTVPEESGQVVSVVLQFPSKSGE